jgi:hypothetical protein
MKAAQTTPIVFFILLLVFDSFGARPSRANTGLSPSPPRNLRDAPVSVVGRDPNIEILPFLGTQSEAAYFSPDIQINYDPGNVIDDFGPVIAVAPNGVIYVVWNTDENFQSIYISRSVDGGVTFSPAVRINDTVAYPPSYAVFQPDIALDGDGNIYVVWHDYRAWIDDNSWTSPIDIYLDKSTDGGLTWGADVLVSVGGSGSYPWHFQPNITIDPTNTFVYVTFTDYDRYHPEGDYGDISIARSVDSGASFAPKMRIDDTPDSLLVVQEFSSVAVDAATGDVFVVFEDSRGTSKDIYLALSSDSAQSFEPNVRVNVDTTRAQEEPSIRVGSSGNVYVVWKDWRDDPDPQSSPYLNHVYLGRSTDGGATFFPGVQVTDEHMNAEIGFNFPPRLAVDNSDAVHVVWHDRRVDTTLCYYDVSTDGGQTFSADVILHDNIDSLTHALPRVAVDSNENPLMVWMDKRNGNTLFDIFFTGVESPSGVGSAASPSFRLGQNYPNPFNPHTAIRYSVGEPSFIEIAVYNVAGKRVRTLVSARMPEGTYQTSWDGTDDRGAPVASGVYLCQMQAGSQAIQRKLVLLR